MSAVVACPNCGAKNRVDPARAATPKCGRCGTPLPAASSATPSDHPVTVTDATFAADVLGGGGTPVLVDCWAAWCGPCRMIAPTIDQLAAESAGRYRVAKLDVDANPRTAAAYRIEGIPALLLFKNGKLVDQLVGLQPKPAIASRVGQVDVRNEEALNVHPGLPRGDDAHCSVGGHRRLEPVAPAGRRDLQVQGRQLRVLALLDQRLGGRVAGPDLGQLGVGRVVLAEVAAQPALSVLHCDHGVLH